jgi:heterodisulfide reductase subunit A-like polyferredoxin
VYNVSVGEDGFVLAPSTNISPALTEQPGIFATGAAMGPMDIVDSIMLAGSAASEASAYLQAQKNGSVQQVTEAVKEAVHA